MGRTRAGMLTEQLYGKHAAALYAQAADFNKTARFYYMKAQDAYYLANAQASYDDWRRARPVGLLLPPQVSAMCHHAQRILLGGVVFPLSRHRVATSGRPKSLGKSCESTHRVCNGRG